MLPRRLAATAVVIAFCGACAPTSRWGEPVAVVPTRAANPLVHPGTLRGVWGGGECTESISDSYEVEITQATICVSRVECVVDFSGAPSGPLAAPREERVTLGVEHDYRAHAGDPERAPEALPAVVDLQKRPKARRERFTVRLFERRMSASVAGGNGRDRYSASRGSISPLRARAHSAPLKVTRVARWTGRERRDRLRT